MQEKGDLPAKLVRIALVGFMGAGKSTVGPLLAARLQWEFVDADEHLEREAGLVVAEIFQRQGEDGFRRMEAATIRKLLQRERIVLALGGGALETEATRLLLQSTPATHIVFLDAPAEILLARCERQTLSEPSASPTAMPLRPLLPSRPLLEELRNDRPRLDQKLAARLPHYQAAHLTINTQDRTAREVAEEIFAKVGIDCEGAPRTQGQRADQSGQEQTR